MTHMRQDIGFLFKGNNNRVRSYKDVIVETNITTRRTFKPQFVVMKYNQQANKCTIAIGKVRTTTEDPGLWTRVNLVRWAKLGL